jgi:hypothetical protein
MSAIRKIAVSVVTLFLGFCATFLVASTATADTGWNAPMECDTGWNCPPEN